MERAVSPGHIQAAQAKATRSGTLETRSRSRNEYVASRHDSLRDADMSEGAEAPITFAGSNAQEQQHSFCDDVSDTETCCVCGCNLQAYS